MSVQVVFRGTTHTLHVSSTSTSTSLRNEIRAYFGLQENFSFVDSSGCDIIIDKNLTPGTYTIESSSQDVKSPSKGVRNDLIFALNGQKVVIPADRVDPHLTLNEYIRDSTKFKGTKIGCGEGGCGACAVVVSRYDAETKKVVENSINSCLRLLAAVDGWSITTVEGLGGSRDGFHPIQERIAGYHGTQCGFCTPGMVVTLYSALKSHNGQGGKNVTMKQMEQFFDGNICRCTGYRPILDAAKSFAKDTDVKDLISKDQPVGPYDESKDPVFPEFLKLHKLVPLHFSSQEDGVNYYRPIALTEVYSILSEAEKDHKRVKVIVGNTSVGIYKEDKFDIFVDVSHIPELLTVSKKADEVTVGVARTVSDLVSTFESLKTELPAEKAAALDSLITHTLRVGNYHVRNAGSIAGNLVMTKTLGFLSDLATILLAASASVTLSSSSSSRTITLQEFVSSPKWKQGEVLRSVTIPYTKKGDIYRTYKASIRPQNSHAYVNAGFLFNVDAKKHITKAVLAFGGVMEWYAKGSHPVRASKLEEFLVGKPLDTATLNEAVKRLKSEIVPHGEFQSYRHRLVSGFFFKFFLTAISEGLGKHHSAIEGTYDRPVTHGHQEFHYDTTSKDPAFKPIHKVEGKIQASGEARYVSDIPAEAGVLHASFVQATIAAGKIVSIDAKEALAAPGVVDVITAKDIPGKNEYPEFGAMLGALVLPKFEFLADAQVHYFGEAVAIVVADTIRHADAAVKLVHVSYEKAEPVITLHQAIEKKSGFGFPIVNQVKKGDAKASLESAKHKISGGVFLGTQKHFYMETQAAYVIPEEDGQFVVHCSAQLTSGIASNISDALKIPQSKIKVLNRRAGGSFGGKFVHATYVVLNATLAAWKLRRPVRLIVSRNVDMQIFGGREETKLEYQLGFDDNGKLHSFTQHGGTNSGWNLDISLMIPMIVNASMSQVYDVNNWDSTIVGYRTNTTGRTAVRGPGEVAASYGIESALAHVAFVLGLSQETVRERNFFGPDVKEPKAANGSVLTHYTVPELWSRLKKKVKYESRYVAAEKYNTENRWKKRGVAMTPVSYKVQVGSKEAAVNIFSDGSVLINHMGCEMGQGLNTKAAQIAASTLGTVLGAPLDVTKIRFGDNNSFVLPNAGGTGGSTGSEEVVRAVRDACQILVTRLKQQQERMIQEAIENAKKEEEDVKAGKAPASDGKAATKLSWENLIRQADFAGVFLQATARTADVDHPEEKFHYNNYGVAFSEIELDVLTGETNVLHSSILYDCGKSLNPAIDIGQCEGAFIMGLGHILREKEELTEEGKIVSDGTWVYKPPGVNCIPVQLDVELLQNEGFDRGILSSKSSGEPPLVLATSIALALRMAVQSARADAGLKEWVQLDIPLTPDQVQAACGVTDKDLIITL